ncbi:sensor histidine kinase [Ramlibacter rhizophilus]|uniref:Sensor histidine kinase n=1 Tax=Ramlibacter rhizophilus TaxID=1781167 RepID=A0A4Z0BF98_9BURK|nr:histidine kinase [Ramlibacter rhizophilus]TFY96528.1 sensor histidine kinase [Ramlibacter rhizophilus]
MRDSKILSAFSELPGTAPRASPAASRAASGPAPALVFDTCHAGVVLRAVLFVQAVGGVGAMFVSRSLADWLGRTAFLSAGILAAVLAWLVVTCGLKRLLARLPAPAQHAGGMLLGALSGLYGCGLLVLVAALADPPWVASAAAGALMAGVVGLALSWRAEQRAPADAAARLSELQARIRPHFLFNTLNSAVALVRQDPARAEAVLEDLADLFRHALAEPGESVMLSEEIALARRYLDIEQVRFGDRLRIEWAIDPRAGTARVPPLVLQPLVENAVKHGVEPSALGAEVRVSAERRAGSVVIKVTNTVPGGQGLPGQGEAQRNVRERLRLLHDVHAAFQCGLQGGVYQVRLEVPA